MITIKILKYLSTLLATSSLMIVLGGSVLAAPPGAQTFGVYDNTNDGLVVGTDPDIGNVEVVANPGGEARLVVNTHLQNAAPGCTYSVELVRDSAATNGGLNEFGHVGSIQVLGELTTNKTGNGNAHFDVELTGDGTVTMYGHLDFEATGSCEESAGDLVVFNEYGAAPDPTLSTPLFWLE